MNNNMLRANELLSKMTLKEKIGQLNQKLYGFSIYERDGETVRLTEDFKKEVESYSGLGVLYGLFRADPWSGKTKEIGLSGALASKVYNMVQAYVIENSRLGIPMLLSSECPHGHQALDGYLLPVNLAVGATFNPKLYKEASKVCGKQLKAMGVDFALVSMLDILRDPRWGRSEECYSEDPYLASVFAKAAVEGIQSEGVDVVAKHFAAQGETTGGVNASAARIGERELREIHLLAMKKVAEAKVKGVMVAYNEIDGIPCHGNKKLLKHILRDELGFDGVVMSDGVAIDQLDVMTEDNVVSGALALKSGVDIGLWDTGFGRLDEALERGLITMEHIDEAVLRVLTVKYERGLFEDPYIKETDQWRSYTYEAYPEALDIARESYVLLKNEGSILPIDKNKITSIAVIGPNADAIYHQLGDYTPPVEDEDGITILKGIQNYVKESDHSIEVKFAKGCDLLTGSEEMIKEAEKIVEEADVTVLVLGGSSSRFAGATFDSNGAAITQGAVHMDCGEGVDSGNLKLPGRQEELIKRLKQIGKPLITLVMGGRPYAISSVLDNSKGLFYSFYPGMMGGKAFAELLFGDSSPSGRLPVSIPREVGQLPVYYNYKSSYQSMNYYDIQKSPLFTFGEGLTYTHFEYSNIELVSKGWSHKEVKRDALASLKEIKEQGIQLKLCIINQGNYDGYAVPQLYVHHKQSTVIARVLELKAFEKVWIPKGSQVECSLSIDKEGLSLWNEDMEFVVEEAAFELILSDKGKEIWRKVIQ
ncbi:MAG TPA: beta-glucosidase [Clostridiales bacterium]|nr:beta-glucosidase [Clostridiales bacterium]